MFACGLEYFLTLKRKLPVLTLQETLFFKLNNLYFPAASGSPQG